MSTEWTKVEQPELPESPIIGDYAIISGKLYMCFKPGEWSLSGRTVGIGNGIPIGVDGMVLGPLRETQE